MKLVTLVLAALSMAPAMYANVLTFDLGPGNVVAHAGYWTYDEAGMEVAWYTNSPTNTPDFVADGSGGYYIQTVNFMDILFYLPGGGTFTPVSMVFRGGIDTRFGGFHGDFVTGGQNPDPGAEMFLNGAGSSVPNIFFDSNWQNITTIDWCDYCVENGYNGGAIDNLVFTTSSVPEPGTGLVLLGILLVLHKWRRSGRAGRDATAYTTRTVPK